MEAHKKITDQVKPFNDLGGDSTLGNEMRRLKMSAHMLGSLDMEK